MSLFANRQIYTNTFTASDLRSYEDIWCRLLNDKFKDTNPIEVIIENDDHLKQELKSAETYKYENENESSCISDKALYQKLKNNIEYLNLDELFTEPTQIDDGNNLNEKNQTDNDSSDYRMTKLKNSNMINTRTGLKYKAPMRGGHSNQVQRHMTNNSTLNLNNSGELAKSNPSKIINNFKFKFLKAGNLQGQQNLMRHLDSFRARLPNTSRPPSLHVDEFYRLENENAKQQQQNIITKQVVNEPSPLGNNLVNIDTSGQFQVILTFVSK